MKSPQITKHIYDNLSTIRKNAIVSKDQQNTADAEIETTHSIIYSHNINLIMPNYSNNYKVSTLIDLKIIRKSIMRNNQTRENM